MTIRYVQPLTRAWDRMVHILFQPFDLAKWLVIGFAAGEIPKIPLNLALLKHGEIVGVFWGDYTRRDPEGNLLELAAFE